MGKAEIGRVALMSIRPGYAQQIIQGTKQVEFRKRPLASDVTHVVIYATAPVSQIVGGFTVGNQVSEAPRNLWKSFKDVGGITYRELMSYYRGYKLGTGIQVKEAFIAATPLSLSDDLGIGHPPQSYRYLETALAKRVLSDITSGQTSESE